MPTAREYVVHAQATGVVIRTDLGIVRRIYRDIERQECEAGVYGVTVRTIV